MIDQMQIVRHIVDRLPQTQAIYLFGSAATDEMLPGSDVDIAVLLPPTVARDASKLTGSQLHLDLESGLARDVDLINLREATTVFQKEIIINGKRIHCPDVNAADEFEMHVLSLYQKLNAERAEILAEGRSSGRFLQT
ncbi:nucleotidyltransferase domain-containing protein [Wenzhouxiangella sp. AB-CW3]|nr:nucleotidyltransferase domain-containing protein [Wenzhouxiangella sp. AB-CW3]